MYVNWGCGAWNSTVDQLRANGWNVWGYEPSAETASQFVATAKAALPTAIAGIFSNNVIEHFVDPVAQFREFHAILPPGAKMAHSSPCYEYRYEFTRFHTYFPVGRSTEALAERTGFRVIDRVEDGEYINVVFERL
nr:class I SAM-dependent methyltransferase [Microvirga tunisiensis]